MGFLRRHPIISILLFAVLVVAGVIVGTGVAVWRAAHNDEARKVDHADVIAVLGAAEYATRPSPVFQGRLQQALQLYRGHFGDEVITLGGKEPGDITTEAEAGRQWLISKGLPADRVVAVPVGRDSLQSIEAAASYMGRHNLDTVFLVSDPWHNLRIRRMARDQGLDAFVSATGSSAARSRSTRLDGYVRETFAYLEYRVFGR